MGVHFLRAVAGASVVGGGVALSFATWVSGVASGEVMAVGGCEPVGVEGAADFGCHFLRSGAGAIGSAVDARDSVGIDEMDGAGAGSAIGGAVGLGVVGF